MRNKRLITKISILVVTILVLGAALSGCIQGLQPIGWSGVAISSDGTLFVGSKEGRLVSMTADGRRQWSEPLKLPAQPGGFGCAPGSGGTAGGFGCSAETPAVAIYGTPALWNDLAFIAGYNGKVYAFVSGTLQQRWVFPREGNLKPIIGGIVLSADKIYFGGTDGKVYALDAATGDKRWEFQLSDEIWSTPAISGNTLYIGSFDKKLYALDTATGSKKWEFQTAGAVVSTPLVQDGTIYFGSLDRNLYALNESDRSVKWTFMADNWFWARPVIADGILYAPSLDNKVFLLDAKTGTKINEFDLQSQVSSSPVVVDRKVVVATQDGKVYSLDRNEKRLLAIVTPNASAPLSANKGIVYVHTPDLTVHPIDVSTGAKLPTISLKKAE